MNLLKLGRFNVGISSSFLLILSHILFGYLINVCVSKVLTNSYLVEFNKETDRALADQIASRHGFTNLGPVS
jgi:hypothetical protein